MNAESVSKVIVAVIALSVMTQSTRASSAQNSSSAPAETRLLAGAQTALCQSYESALMAAVETSVDGSLDHDPRFMGFEKIDLAPFQQMPKSASGLSVPVGEVSRLELDIDNDGELELLFLSKSLGMHGRPPNTSTWNNEYLTIYSGDFPRMDGHPSLPASRLPYDMGLFREANSWEDPMIMKQFPWQLGHDRVDIEDSNVSFSDISFVNLLGNGTETYVYPYQGQYYISVNTIYYPASEEYDASSPDVRSLLFEYGHERQIIIHCIIKS